jgi:hypothetical protein
MDPQVLESLGRTARWKSVLIWIGLISGAALSIAIALYLWNLFDGRIPAVKWLIALLSGFTAICLVAVLIFDRAPLKTVLLVVGIGLGCAAVGFRWGFPGLLFGLVAAHVVTSIVARRKRERMSTDKSLERTRER